MRWLATLVVLVACARPAPVRQHEATLPPGCEHCHAEIAAEWNGSYHRAAYSDATFQRSLAIEEPKDRAFCIDCHAPEARTTGVNAGVGCISCHARPHAGDRAVNGCNGCHQFTFGDGRPALVQRTVDEHAASDFALASCESCHMPSRQGHRDHRFVSSHSPEQLRNGIQVHVERVDATHVRVRIDSLAGHAFPTGDMFRRATLLLFAEREDGAIVDSQERVFGRTWGAERGGTQFGHRRELSDTRLRGHHEELVELGTDQPIVRVQYELRFERILAMRAGEATIESSDVLHRGTVPMR